MNEQAPELQRRPDFFRDGGQTGALLRAHDWSASPIGEPSSWPQSLRTALSLMLGAAQPVYIAWGPELISFYNDAYLPIVGTKHPGIGLPFAVLWEEIYDEFLPLIEKTLAGEAQHFVDMPIALAGRPGIEVGYFTFSYTALRDDFGSVAGFYCAATETTDRVCAEIALRASETRFRGAVDGMTEGFGLLAPDYTILELNAYAMRLETRSRKEIIGRSHWDVYPASEHSEVGRLLKQAMSERVPVALEHRYAWEDGRVAWLDMRAYPTPEGGLAVFYRDVTKKLLAEERLRESEEQQRFLLALADEVRTLGDPLAAVTATTRALGARLGASRVVYADVDEDNDAASTAGDWTDGTVSHLPERLRLSDYGSRLLAPLRRGETLRVQDVREHEATLASLAALHAIGVGALVSVPLVKDGRFVANINVHQSSPRVWTDAEVKLIEAVAERTWEALERSRAAAALRASEARHSATLEIQTVGVVYFDMTGGITDANDAFLRMIGYTREELLAGQVRYENLTPSEWAWRDEKTIHELLTTGNGGPAEKEYFRRDGSRMCILCASKRLDEHLAVEFIVDVTERKSAELKLRETGDRLELAVDNAEVGFWDVDEVNHALIWPPRTKAMFGISAEVPVTMQDFFDGLHPDDRIATSEAYVAAADPERRALYDVEYRTVGKEDGVIRWVAAKGRGVFDGDGRCLRVAGTVIDITARKAAEVALRESEEFNRRILQSSSDCIKVLDLDGRLEFMSEGGMCVMEVDDFSAIEGGFWSDFWPGEGQDMALAALEAAKRGGTGRLQGFARTMKGTPRWWDVAVTPINGPDGRPEKLLSVSRDVTATKDADAALRASEERFQAIANSVDQMIWTAEPDGSHDYYNERWYDFIGLPRGSTSGDLWEGLLHPDDVKHAGAIWRHSLDSGEPYRVEYRLRHHSGQYRWVIGRAQCVHDELGQITRWFGTCTDIHDIVEAREVLARSRQELEQLVDERTAERDRMWETSPDLMVVLDFQGLFRRVNPAWTTILGYTIEDLVGHHVNEFVIPDDHAATVGAYETVAAGDRPVLENRYRHRDGSIRWISWVAAPAGHAAYAIGRDVTSAKERQAALEATQDALRQSQKMEAVGQLTGGIAHDFNNMLAIIMGSLQLLARRVGTTDERAKRYVDAATDGARRAALLTARLLAFSRQQPLQPEPVDANKLVAGMSDLLQHSLGGAVQLETVLSGGLWRTHADPNQLENVIVNLAVNARDAMPDGGKLTIETQNAHLDSRYVAGHLGVTAGQYVLIAVSDTGSGMADEVIAKAFDPFFTTKEVGKGTGLGLSQVYGFVKQSGGHVKIYSEVGQGTSFKIYLPRYNGQAGKAQDKSASEVLPLGEAGEVVLVVEDEPAVRQFSVEALSDLGYRVLEADGAASALRLLDAHPEIKLLFTDIVMPEVNGAKLAAEARRRRPDLRVLFTTGYTRNAVVHNGVVDPGVELIGKPFTLDELAAKVREVLDAAA